MLSFIIFIDVSPCAFWVIKNSDLAPLFYHSKLFCPWNLIPTEGFDYCSYADVSQNFISRID